MVLTMVFSSRLDSWKVGHRTECMSPSRDDHKHHGFVVKKNCHLAEYVGGCMLYYTATSLFHVHVSGGAGVRPEKSLSSEHYHIWMFFIKASFL